MRLFLVVLSINLNFELHAFNVYCLITLSVDINKRLDEETFFL